MRSIEAGTPLSEPPRWAVLERRLFDLLSEAVEPVVSEYVADDGSLLWPPADDYVGVDALDDAYESFFNWPLAYLLGGDERLLDLSIREFDAITEQFSGYDTGFGHPMVVDEYEQGFDWFHQSEGYLFFYLLCMAAPDREATAGRAERFADYYLNEQDVTLYDEQRRLVRAPMVGSQGPAFRNFSTEAPEPQYGSNAETRIPFEETGWAERYGLPFYDLPGIDGPEDLDDPETARRMGEALRDRCSRGDVAQNLSITTLVTNAYLCTGDDAYRDWVTEYVDAWIERTEANDGRMPDNVGLSGAVGEYLDGKWYGGFWGWTWPHGWHSLGAAPTTAAINATLLTGDPGYLRLPRSQIDRLMENGIERDGTLHIPYKYGDEATHSYGTDWNAGEDVLRDEDGNVLWRDGYFEFRPTNFANTSYVTHLWFASMRTADRNRLRRLRDHTTEDWTEVQPSPALKDRAGHEYPWLAYLAGNFPDYPAEILAYNHQQVYDRLSFLRADDQDPDTYRDYYLQHRNPISTEGLVQCTMGAPQVIYHGGLQLATVRHFDPERQRPGLPPDVAALVTDVAEDRAAVRLVNLAATPRVVVVQAGAFAEHRFGRLSYTTGDDRAEKRAVDVADDAVRVSLPGGTETRLEATLDRYVGDPTYRFPWDRQGPAGRE
ncbi:MAG: hypothetical protein ABEJ08_02770 [Halobacteriaceae archaeon]